MQMQSESRPFTQPDSGQKIRVTISNDAILLLKEGVDAFLDGKYGDTDDTRQKKLAQELKENLHLIWRELNPS
jgi:hypothetical protein